MATAGKEKICLIRCPSPFLIDERVFPPLGLMAVGTALKELGYQVVIHDGAIEEIPTDCKAYGLGPTIPEYAYALHVKEFIQRNNQNAKIILGGPYATLSPDSCLSDGFDCVVVGDGENAIEQAITNGARKIIAPERPLDAYPTIDRTILDLQRYNYILNGRRATTVMTSQGCPYKCAFCSKTYHTVRFRSIPRVIEEIEHLYYVLDYNAIAFPEDLFILVRKRVEAFCDCLKELGIIWRCLVRGDVAVRYGNKFVKMMADSGCVEVGMGIESGSDKILKIINKGETTRIIKLAIEMLKSEGIRVKGFFIVGLPGESHKTIEDTKRFLDEAQLDDVDVKIYQPYPGSPIWLNRSQYDIQWSSGDYAGMFYKGRPGEYYGSVRTSSLTTEQIYDAWVQLEATYKWHAET